MLIVYVIGVGKFWGVDPNLGHFRSLSYHAFWDLMRGYGRWYHYWCVGHLDMHDPKLRWICPACREEDD